MAISPAPCGVPRPARLLATLGASLLALMLAEAAPAGGPEGGTVVGGKARIVQTPGRTAIRQTSERAVIDWRGFDVGRDHQVVFGQPGRSAATLNRVLTARPSVIEGAIRAPGTVIIQNGAGVLFTGTARVDVGGLVATSHAIDAGRFQRDGRLSIGSGTRSGARVANEGRITVGEAGLAALVGDQVENTGVIVARRGTVALAGGTRSTIDLAGDGLVRIAVDGDGSVTNSGRIEGERVLLSAGAAAQALDAAINTSGVIRADAGTGRGGRIELVARGGGRVRISGTLDASGAAEGGDIVATGARVDVASAARVAARGGTTGGSIRIGGDAHGSGPLRRATAVRIDAGAELAADGAARGGRIVAWSDGLTEVDGTLSARGAGGFVETSGRVALAIGAAAKVSAARWLLDPQDILIADGPGGPLPGGALVVSRIALEAALNGGADVTVTTSAPPDAEMPGDITVAVPLDWTGTGDLRLEAARDIAINAAVTTRDGNFTADAGRWLAWRPTCAGPAPPRSPSPARRSCSPTSPQAIAR